METNWGQNLAKWRQCGDRMEPKHQKHDVKWRKTGRLNGDKMETNIETKWRQNGDKMETSFT